MLTDISAIELVQSVNRNACLGHTINDDRRSPNQQRGEPSWTEFPRSPVIATLVRGRVFVPHHHDRPKCGQKDFTRTNKAR